MEGEEPPKKRRRDRRSEMKVGESSWGPYYAATTGLWHSRSLFQHGIAERRGGGRLVLGTEDARSASLHLGNAVTTPDQQLDGHVRDDLRWSIRPEYPSTRYRRGGRSRVKMELRPRRRKGFHIHKRERP